MSDHAFFDMLWKWFEERGAIDRDDWSDGKSPDDFKAMLDDHELECLSATPERAAREILTLREQLVSARKALKPFANGKLPSSRRSEIAFDRNGLRRAISPLELACDEAFRTLALLTDDQGNT